MLRVIRPIEITDAMLVAHSEPEADYPAWSSVTTYAKGGRVIKGHRIWESAAGSNTNNDPEAEGTTFWLDAGPTNQRAMFDGMVNTATVAATTTLEVTLAPGEFATAVGLAAVVGAEVRVRSVSGSTTVYDQTQVVNAGTDPNPYDWCFGDRDESGDLLFTDLPPYLDAQITVTISGGGSFAECGVLALGRIYDVGDVEYGVQAGITDYSIKTTNDFGAATFKRRKNAKRMSLPIVLGRSEFRPTHALLSSLTATPCMWIGNDDTDVYGPLFVWGWYRDFRMVVEYRNTVRTNLEIEGLT